MSLLRSVQMRMRRLRLKIAGNHARFVWPLLPLAAGGILWMLVDNEIAAEREGFDQAMSAAARSMASGYAQYLTRSVDQMDQVTLQLKHDWEQSRGRLRLPDLVARGIFTSPQYVEVRIVDRSGLTVTATARTRAGRSSAGTPYFEWHRSNISSALRISAPEHDPAGGRAVLHFTRRLDTEDNDFDGIVSVSVRPEYFSAFYDANALGQRGLLAVIGDDGMLRTSRIGAREYEATAGLPIALPPQAAGENWLAPDRFADRERRFAAWRTLSAYPLVVLVGLSENERLAPLQTKWAAYRRARLAGEAALLALAVILAFLRHAVERKKIALRSIRAGYRLATEAGEEGFYMLHPVREENGRIVDFRFLDCNERGAGLLGKGRRELLGQTLSSNYRREDFVRLHGVYCHALEAGSYREEVPFHLIGGAGERWVRRKIVRSGEALAVTLRDITDAKRQERELIRLANTDELTAMPNRAWLIRTLESTIGGSKRKTDTLALLFIDLDKFKNVNDTLGHASGDIVLQEAARRLRHALRPSDHVARLGGDEFTAVLHHAGSDDDISSVANRILEALAQPFRIGQATMELGASIGISVYPRDGASVETLLKHADIALYLAKDKRRGAWLFYDQTLHDLRQKRIDTERELAEAIEADQFLLHYQPRVDAASGRLLSAEALVRWQHPRRGMVPPLDFIPVAEQTGLIVRLGALVIDKACRQIAQWRAQGIEVVPVSVNVSAVQFQGDVQDVLKACLARHEVAPGLIEVELTESAMLDEQSAVVRRLGLIRELGITMAVDDFGTGYSSLSQLQRLDMDVLKVDRVFTADLGRTAESEVLFKAIVSMAHALDMRVVAEGVETGLQARMLRDIGCDELQGYLISKPVPADDMAALLRQARCGVCRRQAALSPATARGWFERHHVPARAGSYDDSGAMRSQRAERAPYLRRMS